MEIHCGAEQQHKMAKIFRELLGRELLLEPLSGIEEGKLPSPEDLKYKILLKVHIPLMRALTNKDQEYFGGHGRRMLGFRNWHR